LALVVFALSNAPQKAFDELLVMLHLIELGLRLNHPPTEKGNSTARLLNISQNIEERLFD